MHLDISDNNNSPVYDKRHIEAAAPPWTSFEIARGVQGSNLLIVCDHATNLLPPEYGSLGLDDFQLQRHIGYDIGALGVSLEMGRRLGATVVSSRFSRLLIDPNRGEDDPTLIMQISDGAVVPGNARLSAAERAKRIALYHAPYHRAVAAEIAAIQSRGLRPVIASIHSYTPVWRGVPRKWHAAVLWDTDPQLAVPLISDLRVRTGLEIGDNEPYAGGLGDDTMSRHATARGLPGVLIEVRQDLIRDTKGQVEWAAILSASLSAIAPIAVDIPSTSPDIEAQRRTG